MSESPVILASIRRTHSLSLIAIAALACFVLIPSSLAQQAPAPSAAPAKSAPAAAPAPAPRPPEKPLPGLDLSSMDLTADP